MIKIKQITKTINNVLVLDNVEFKVGAGEIVGLVGPNGAGKTTLLNIIAGIWYADRGGMELDGQDHASIGYVPDVPYLYSKLTGREFLRFVGSLYKIDDSKIEKKISELEKALELSLFLDEIMDGYPRGVRQKITFAAMLLHSPKHLLLDEPLTNLDPKSSKLVKELLQNMAKNGASILLSTHILDIAEKICNRIVVIHKGKKVAEGTIEQLREEAKIPSNNLEDIFLQLTGGEKYTELLQYLT